MEYKDLTDISNSIKKDEYKHIVAGVGAFAVGRFISSGSVGVGFSCVLAVTIIKEIYDIKRKGLNTEDALRDILATGAGGFLGYLSQI